MKKKDFAIRIESVLPQDSSGSKRSVLRRWKQLTDRLNLMKSESFINKKNI